MENKFKMKKFLFFTNSFLIISATLVLGYFLNHIYVKNPLTFFPAKAVKIFWFIFWTCIFSCLTRRQIKEDDLNKANENENFLDPRIISFLDSASSFLYKSFSRPYGVFISVGFIVFDIFLFWFFMYIPFGLDQSILASEKDYENIKITIKSENGIEEDITDTVFRGIYPAFKTRERIKSDFSEKSLVFHDEIGFFYDEIPFEKMKSGYLVAYFLNDSKNPFDFMRGSIKDISKRINVEIKYKHNGNYNEIVEGQLNPLSKNWGNFTPPNGMQIEEFFRDIANIYRNTKKEKGNPVTFKVYPDSKRYFICEFDDKPAHASLRISDSDSLSLDDRKKILFGNTFQEMIFNPKDSKNINKYFSNQESLCPECFKFFDGLNSDEKNIFVNYIHENVLSKNNGMAFPMSSIQVYGYIAFLNHITSDTGWIFKQTAMEILNNIKVAKSNDWGDTPNEILLDLENRIEKLPVIKSR